MKPYNTFELRNVLTESEFREWMQAEFELLQLQGDLLEYDLIDLENMNRRRVLEVLGYY